MSDSESTPNALVLPEERASTGEAVVYPGFPGVYRPGVPVLLDTIELDLMTARARISELGLPLVEHAHDGDEETPVPDANPPRFEGNQPFGDALAAPEPPHGEQPEPELEDRTIPQLREFARQQGIDLTGKTKKDEILEAFADYAAASASGAGQQGNGGDDQNAGDGADTGAAE